MSNYRYYYCTSLLASSIGIRMRNTIHRIKEITGNGISDTNSSGADPPDE